MTIDFAGLRFEKYNDGIALTSVFGDDCARPCGEQNFFVEAQIAGENRDVQGARQIWSSEKGKFKFAGHELQGNSLIIIQRSEFVEAAVTFTSYPDCGTVRVKGSFKNISGREICLESVSAFNFNGLGRLDECNDIFLYRFTNGNHCECQPRVRSLFEYGLFDNNGMRTSKRVFGNNTGSWSSKEELPQAILENRKTGRFFMFQIENSGSWYWEIGENFYQLYLLLGGPNQESNQWSKRLKPGESFECVPAAVCGGGSINEVVGEMTKYRRHIVEACMGDTELPVIFNEYMHLSWCNPSESNTAALAPSVAALGVDCYVIDCGWHDETDDAFNNIGCWRESKKRFPGGIRRTIDLIHSTGMKAGLWLEIEDVSQSCSEMREYYGDDCFFSRNGGPTIKIGRLQLDFRHPKVIEFMRGLFRRMVEEYGVDYIKIDYNQCAGAGTETASDSLGDGLLGHNRAYIGFIREISRKYPRLILESCASGGQRMDYQTLSVHSLQSTSDQTDYRRYPYIAANMLSAVLPEQAAVWSYPVSDVRSAQEYSEQAADTTDERIVYNMVNAMLGRIHLASHVELLPESKRAFIREGIAYCKSIAPYKKSALPYFPLGFTDFNADKAAAGFTAAGRLFLAVWNMKESKTVEIPLRGLAVSGIKVAYPSRLKTKFSVAGGALRIKFDTAYQARFFEMEIGNVK